MIIQEIFIKKIELETCSVAYGNNPNDEGLITFNVSDSLNLKEVDLT